MKLLDTDTKFGVNADGLYREHTQTITSDFIDGLKCERAAKEHMRSAEVDRVASVPTFVVELWMRQGFDFYKASAKEIVARLNAHDLQAFISTPKKV